MPAASASPRATQSPPTGAAAHLKVLGLAPGQNYTAADVTRAFRTQALTAHPDKPSGSATAFRNVITARDALLKRTEMHNGTTATAAACAAGPPTRAKTWSAAAFAASRQHRTTPSGRKGATAAAVPPPHDSLSGAKLTPFAMPPKERFPAVLPNNVLYVFDIAPAAFGRTGLRHGDHVRRHGPRDDADGVNGVIVGVASTGTIYWWRRGSADATPFGPSGVGGPKFVRLVKKATTATSATAAAADRRDPEQPGSGFRRGGESASGRPAPESDGASSRSSQYQPGASSRSSGSSVDASANASRRRRASSAAPSAHNARRPSQHPPAEDERPAPSAATTASSFNSKMSSADVQRGFSFVAHTDSKHAPSAARSSTGEAQPPSSFGDQCAAIETDEATARADLCRRVDAYVAQAVWSMNLPAYLRSCSEVDSVPPVVRAEPIPSPSSARVRPFGSKTFAQW